MLMEQFKQINPNISVLDKKIIGTQIEQFSYHPNYNIDKFS